MSREEFVKLVFEKRLEYKSWATIAKELGKAGIVTTPGKVEYALKDKKSKDIVGSYTFNEARKVILTRISNEAVKLIFRKAIARNTCYQISKELENIDRYHSEHVVQSVIRNKKNIDIVGMETFRKANKIKPILVSDIITGIILQKRNEGKTHNKICVELEEIGLIYTKEEIATIIKDENNKHLIKI